jgi:hypothetical protein
MSNRSEERHGRHTVSLPVLDVRESSIATAKSLVNSVSKHGFVYIKNNHGEIPSKDVGNMFDLVYILSFFILSSLLIFLL